MPVWMLGPDDMGQVLVLVLRRKTVEKEQNEQRKDADSLLDSFVVGTSIELKVGVEEARTINATREGRGTRYLLRTSSRSIYEKLIKITELTDGTEVEITPHPTLNTVQGVVYDPDSINKDENVILNYLKAQGVQSVRRIRKRINGGLKNTPVLILTFHGTILPKFVYFGILRMQVRTYYPSPMICFKCGSYGHSKKSCQQAAICLRCSMSHDLPEGEQCTNPPNCLYCKTGHQTTSRECPKYKQEESIVSLKVDKCISYTEARRIFAEENKQKTFSGVVQDQIQQQLVAKDHIIATLQKQVATLTKELADVKHILQSRSQNQSPVSSNQQTSPPFQKPTTKISQPITLKQNSPGQNSRLSRKDQHPTSPPIDRRDNRKHNRQEYEIHTRSRSGKRHIEISPTDGTNHRGKRKSAQHNINRTPTDADGSRLS